MVGLATTKGCLERCRLLVSTDSGPRHVAAALGKPVVTLLGPTLPVWIENPSVRGATVRLPLANVAEGTVVAQDPPAHAQDIARPTVNLLVAAPDVEGADGYVMPDVVGTPAASALAVLTKAGIKATAKPLEVAVGHVGAGSELPKAPVPPGAVLSQTPAAGVRVDLSTVVKLTVAK